MEKVCATYSAHHHPPTFAGHNFGCAVDHQPSVPFDIRILLIRNLQIIFKDLPPQFTLRRHPTFLDLFLSTLHVASHGRSHSPKATTRVGAHRGSVEVGLSLFACRDTKCRSHDQDAPRMRPSSYSLPYCPRRFADQRCLLSNSRAPPLRTCQETPNHCQPPLIAKSYAVR